MREKRRFISFNVALETAYIVQKDPKIEKIGVTRDVSARGMQLLTNDKLEPGNEIYLKISVPKALNPAHIKGVVVWSREQDTAGNYPYSAGIDFKKIEEDNKNIFLRFLCSLMY